MATIIGISSSVLMQDDDNSSELNTINEIPVTSESDKVMITTTTNVITDLVENIGRR